MTPRAKPKHAEKPPNDDKASRLRKHNHHHSSISINSTKSKIRNVRRVLEHSQDLPPGIRIEKERALAGYKLDLERAVEGKKRNEIIGRYHMVRFFERKKAERSLKKARAQLSLLSLSSSSSAGLGQEVEEDEDEKPKEWKRRRKLVHMAEVDVNYTIYYPLTEKYVSLFPKGGESSLKGGNTGGDNVDDHDHNNDEEDRIQLNKPPLWTTVEQCMASGTLDKLRDGKYDIKPDGSAKTRDDYSVPAPTSSSSRSGNQTNKKKSATADKVNIILKNKPANNDDDEDSSSDGAFFES